VFCADLLERMPPEAVAVLLPEEGRFVERSKYPFFDDEFDLLCTCATGATGGAVSLLRFLPNFFFVVVSKDVDVVVVAVEADWVVVARVNEFMGILCVLRASSRKKVAKEPIIFA